MTDGPVLTFEFFPVRNPARVAEVRNAVGVYSMLDAALMTVTFGAGGSARDGTLEMLALVKEELAKRTAGHIARAAHLSAVGLPIADVEPMATRLWCDGVRNIVAITGDLKGKPMPEGHFPSSTPLIAALIKAQPGFVISVAGHPRQNDDAAMNDIKRKLDAGGCHIITQYDFNAENQLNYRDRIAAAGIKAPVSLGLMPINDFTVTTRLANEHWVKIESSVAARFAPLPVNRHPEEGHILLTEQMDRLKQGGATHIHVYTMNRSLPAVSVIPKVWPETLSNHHLAVRNMPRQARPLLQAAA